MQFLAANSVTASDWENLKKSNPEKAEELIDLFSDIVWEKVLTKTEFIEIRQRKVLRIMKFGDKMAELIQIAINDDDFDFRIPENIESLAEGRTKLNSLKPEIHKGKKSYPKSRNDEVFYHLEQGGTISKEDVWVALESSLS